jgi:tRNA threonylcarbamoyladenosine biosynthesis protein TsaE
MNFITNTVEETIELGEKIGRSLKPGDIVCIDGDLGSGKTHLTKGIALGLGIGEHITSPTFNIVNEYEGRIKLYHFDVYRVNDPDEIAAIGFDEYIFSDAVSVIEWSDYIKELIPDDHIQINISNESITRRNINIRFFGKRYDNIKEALQ